VILVCGGLADKVTELVCARLEDCNYPYRLLDLGTYPTGFRVKWHWRGDGPTGYIAGSDWTLDLNDLTGVYVRYLGEEGRAKTPDLTPQAQPAIYNECDSGLMALLEDLPCPVMNRVGGGLSNNSKVFQALFVRECGLLTPPTLVTTDPEAALDFYERYNGEVIYKSLSGVRSIVRRLTPAQLTRLPLLQDSPGQFQAFIPGHNVRVHTVGDQVFATRVYSEEVDYRYASREGREVKMEPFELPPEVAEASLALAHRLDLLLTGIDFKETPEGQYYCFEVNPSPGFLYYERHTHQPISSAIADLLHLGTHGRHNSWTCI
jgi:glutathione synthase/RimK-type ligase-like ATP-grasp enzyme